MSLRAVIVRHASGAPIAGRSRVEAWELDAREQIRDLVAAYNAHGDRGRFDELLALFADDAPMDIGDGATYEGVNAIP